MGTGEANPILFRIIPIPRPVVNAMLTMPVYGICLPGLWRNAMAMLNQGSIIALYSVTFLKTAGLVITP